MFPIANIDWWNFNIFLLINLISQCNQYWIYKSFVATAAKVLKLQGNLFPTAALMICLASAMHRKQTNAVSWIRQCMEHIGNPRILHSSGPEVARSHICICICGSYLWQPQQQRHIIAANGNFTTDFQSARRVRKLWFRFDERALVAKLFTSFAIERLTIGRHPASQCSLGCRPRIYIFLGRWVVGRLHSSSGNYFILIYMWP